MKVHFGFLQVLNHVYKSIPQNTPNRYDHIHSSVEMVWRVYVSATEEKSMVIIDVGDRYSDSSVESNLEVLKKLGNKLPMREMDNSSLSTMVVLLPTKLVCCQKYLKMDGRYANTTLYTEHGVSMRRNFHGKCSKFEISYHHGYHYDKKTNERTYEVGSTPYLPVSSSMGFSLWFLCHITHEMFMGCVSFESAAGKILLLSNKALL